MARKPTAATSVPAKTTHGDGNPHQPSSGSGNTGSPSQPIRPANALPRPSPITPHTMDTADLTAMQIDLLQKAIGIVKSHASEAANNLAKLRSLMPAEEEEDTESPSPRYQALVRQRWLEERRELDATRALWATCQHVEAIISDDPAFFSEQRAAQQRRQRWEARQWEAEKQDLWPIQDEETPHTPFYLLSTSRRRRRPATDLAPALPPLPAAVPHSRTRLMPLALASKADPAALQRKTNRVSSTSSDSSSGSSSGSEPRTPMTSTRALDMLDHREVIGTKCSGTATIYRTTAPNRRRAGSQAGANTVKAPPSHAPPTPERAVDVDVEMPDYVADLLSEFEARSTVPSLSLLSPLDSTLNELVSSKREREVVVSPKSAPASPARPPPVRRSLHKAPSAKRLSGFFSKRQSTSSASNANSNNSPYLVHHSTQVPSRLGSSIDLVIPEDRPFALDLDLDFGRTGDGGRRGLSGLNPKRFSDSAAASRVSLLSARGVQSEDTPNAPPQLDALSFSSPPPASAPATTTTTTATASTLSSEATEDLTSPPTSAKSAATIDTVTPAEQKRFTAKLRKRISALGF